MGQPSHYAIKGLRKKILLSSVIYTLAALLIISLLSIIPLINWMRGSAERHLIHAAEIRSLAVEEYLARMVEITRQINSRSAARQYLAHHLAERLPFEQVSSATRAILKDALATSIEAVGITRTDRDGRVIAEVGQVVPVEILPILGGAIPHIQILDPILLEDQLFLVVRGTIFDDTQLPLGYDLVMFTTTNLQRILWNPTALGISGESFLARQTENTTVLFFPSHRGKDEIYNLRLDDSHLQAAISRATSGETGDMRIPADGSAGKRVVAFAPVSGSDWALLVTKEQQELMAPVRKQVFTVAGLVLLLTALATLGMLVLLRPMTGRVMVFAEELDNLNRDLKQEISERKKAEISLLRSQREWERTFEAITDAVAIRDIQGNLLKMNHATAQLLQELAPGEKAETGCRRLFGFDKPPPECLFCRMVAEKEAQCGERHLAEVDRWFHVACYPLFDDDNTLWGGVLVAQDVSEQKKMERIKDEMISSVSHEMRTPLTAMLGFVEFMLENPVERAQQIDYLQTIYRETERLNELVSNFLDLQRLQAQVESYHFKKLDICSLLHETAHLFKVASKKHQVNIQCPEQLPKVQVDEKRLMQALKNLLSNAIKYSPEGGNVMLSAQVEKERIVISVQDQGMGIPSQMRERIFERFYRVDESDRRMPGGIGLGLSLVREVIKSHGGEVWVESETGVGSTFYFSLPLEGSKAQGN